MAPVPFRVSRRRRETRDTWTLELEPVAGETLAPAPGPVHDALRLRDRRGADLGLRRAADGPLVHTVRAVGAVTEAICASRPGAVLGVRGPFGNAWPVEEAVASDVVVVAGGIGLAPLRPARLPRPPAPRRVSARWRSSTAAGRPATSSTRRELAAAGAAGSTSRSTSPSTPPTAAGSGKVGVVPKLIAGARFDPASTVALVCGPEIMMRFAARALLERGVPPERIYLSMERNMQCGLGHCGHCQLGPTLICRDGPVYRYDELEPLMAVREL